MKLYLCYCLTLFLGILNVVKCNDDDLDLEEDIKFPPITTVPETDESESGDDDPSSLGRVEEVLPVGAMGGAATQPVSDGESIPFYYNSAKLTLMTYRVDGVKYAKLTPKRHGGIRRIILSDFSVWDKESNSKFSFIVMRIPRPGETPFIHIFIRDQTGFMRYIFNARERVFYKANKTRTVHRTPSEESTSSDDQPEDFFPEDPGHLERHPHKKLTLSLREELRRRVRTMSRATQTSPSDIEETKGDETEASVQISQVKPEDGDEEGEEEEWHTANEASQQGDHTIMGPESMELVDSIQDQDEETGEGVVQIAQSDPTHPEGESETDDGKTEAFIKIGRQLHEVRVESESSEDEEEEDRETDDEHVSNLDEPDGDDDEDGGNAGGSGGAPQPGTEPDAGNEDQGKPQSDGKPDGESQSGGKTGGADKRGGTSSDGTKMRDSRGSHGGGKGTEPDTKVDPKIQLSSMISGNDDPEPEEPEEGDVPGNIDPASPEGGRLPTNSSLNHLGSGDIGGMNPLKTSTPKGDFTTPDSPKTPNLRNPDRYFSRMGCEGCRSPVRARTPDRRDKSSKSN